MCRLKRVQQCYWAVQSFVRRPVCRCSHTCTRIKRPFADAVNRCPVSVHDAWKTNKCWRPSVKPIRIVISCMWLTQDHGYVLQMKQNEICQHRHNGGSIWFIPQSFFGRLTQWQTVQLVKGMKMKPSMII